MTSNSLSVTRQRRELNKSTCKLLHTWLGDKGEETLMAGLRKTVMYVKINAVPLPNSQKAAFVLFWDILKLKRNPIQRLTDTCSNNCSNST